MEGPELVWMGNMLLTSHTALLGSSAQATEEEQHGNATRLGHVPFALKKVLPIEQPSQQAYFILSGWHLLAQVFGTPSDCHSVQLLKQFSKA